MQRKTMIFFYFELGFEKNGNLTVLDSHDALYFKKIYILVNFSKFSKLSINTILINMKNVRGNGQKIIVVKNKLRH